MNQLVQNGPTRAHGRTWPMYERQAFGVEVIGSIDTARVEDAERIKAELDAVLSRYGVEVRVFPVLDLFMLPEDQAEKEALDQAAIEN